MRYFWFFSIFLQPLWLFSQKTILDSADISNWPSISQPRITDDGSYISYSTNVSSKKKGSIMIQSASGIWQKEISGGGPGFFSRDSKKFFFTKGDTLCFLLLGTDSLRYIGEITSYKQTKSDKIGWLAYQLKKNKSELVLINLTTGGTMNFPSVTEYGFDRNGSVLLLKRTIKQDSFFVNSLQWIDLPSGKDQTIYLERSSDNKTNVGNYNFDDTGEQLAFVIQRKKNSQIENEIWYYKRGMKEAVLNVSTESPGMEPQLSIKNFAPQFSKNGKWLFFTLQIEEPLKRKPDVVMVDVWRYSDVVLQSAQLQEAQINTFKAVKDVLNAKVIRIEYADERIITNVEKINGEYLVVANNYSVNENWWKLTPHQSYYLFCLKDGSRKLITNQFGSNFSFSPKGDYIVYYDRSRGYYFSRNLINDKVLNISKDIPARLNNEYLDDRPGPPNIPVGIGGWVEEDGSLLIYDNYDIWRIDPENKRGPRNITNGYGFLHGIKFRLVYENDELERGIKVTDTLLLTAYNTKNKHNGFFSSMVGDRKNPQILTMGPYSLYRKNSQLPFNAHVLHATIRPIKACSVNTWIVERMSFNEAPNYFLTSDFKTYNPITNLNPQKNYNWLSAELINWKSYDGHGLQGILYKPENFDSQKKYPLIINYYEKLSHRLYEFPEPGFVEHNINIPWFVSRGYLVFTPDISYTVGKTGQSVYNSVISAVNYLMKVPWIDNKRIGLQGHSFGGYETNVLITHSNLFAAAVEAAGSADLISAYGGITGLGSSRQFLYEVSQSRIGATLWQRPDLYIQNSPIFKADRITTPLLIVHNKHDPAVPWEQGLELFLALRRLGKKAWMLQYDEGDHFVNGKNSIDYTIRITQFFDYYLKGCNPPEWMTIGIPASKKGVETGYKLDMTGKKP